MLKTHSTINGLFAVSVIIFIGYYFMDSVSEMLWKFILDYKITRSALIYPLTTNIETLLLYCIFYVVDMFFSHKRLKSITNSRKDKNANLNAWKLALKNMFWLSFFLLCITFVTTGDIHGGYGIQGIDESRLPSEAPSFNRWIIEIVIIMLCTDFFLYWLHRIHHWLPLYRRIHSVHHAFHEPLAAHATSVHLFELFTVAPFIFLVPRMLYELVGFHPLSIYFSAHCVAFHGVIEHCGYDDYLESISFGLVTGSKMHFVHHQVSKANYGFYTYFWDWLFGTKLTYEDMLNRKKRVNHTTIGAAP